MSYLEELFHWAVSPSVSWSFHSAFVLSNAGEDCCPRIKFIGTGHRQQESSRRASSCPQTEGNLGVKHFDGLLAISKRLEIVNMDAEQPSHNRILRGG